MNELERYKKALEVANDLLTELYAIHAYNDITRAKKEIDTILNPPPVYEEVEITRWECDVCGKVYKHDITPELPCGDGCDSKSYTCLSGLRRVEKPQPRERRVSVEALVKSDGYVVSKTDDTGYTKIAFYHAPETHGKRGVLTFTWQE